jgi:hypothetical protein
LKPLNSVDTNDEPPLDSLSYIEKKTILLKENDQDQLLTLQIEFESVVKNLLEARIFFSGNI